MAIGWCAESLVQHQSKPIVALAVTMRFDRPLRMLLPGLPMTLAGLRNVGIGTPRVGQPVDGEDQSGENQRKQRAPSPS